MYKRPFLIENKPFVEMIEELKHFVDEILNQKEIMTYSMFKIIWDDTKNIFVFDNDKQVDKALKKHFPIIALYYASYLLNNKLKNITKDKDSISPTFHWKSRDRGHLSLVVNN
jgi:hypothetical protein